MRQRPQKSNQDFALILGEFLSMFFFFLNIILGCNYWVWLSLNKHVYLIGSSWHFLRHSKDTFQAIHFSPGQFIGSDSFDSFESAHPASDAQPKE